MASETALKEKTEKRDRRIKYSTLFTLFMVGSLLGVLIEGIWYAIDHGGWETHVVTISGPFCIIYGFGMAGCYIGSVLMEDRKWWERFITFAFIGAFVEWICGWTILRGLGMRAWDYSDKALNIMGIVDLNMALVWGAIGAVFNKAVPYIDTFMEKIEGSWYKAAVYALSIYMAINLLWTTTVLNRWSNRHWGYEAKNAISRKIDDWYPDERLEERYVEWWFVDPEDFS